MCMLNYVDERTTQYETGECPVYRLRVPLYSAPASYLMAQDALPEPDFTTLDIELMQSEKVLLRLPDQTRSSGRLMLSLGALKHIVFELEQHAARP